MVLILFLLAAVLVAVVEMRLYQKRTFRNFQYRCYFPVTEAREGEEIELVEELVNQKLLPIPWLRSDFSTSKWLDFAGTRSVITDDTRYVVSFFWMGSHQRIIRRWKVKCRKRGVFTIDKVQLMATDLLGFCLAAQTVETGARITVLPAPELPVGPEYCIQHLIGELTVPRHIVDDPFTIAGIRAYQDFDPMNRINWLATARAGHLMVRECAFTTSPSLAVLLNLHSCDFERDRPIRPELVENGIRLCAGLFEEAGHHNLPLEFSCNGVLPGTDEPVETQTGMGPEFARELLRLLAQLPMPGQLDFAAWVLQEIPRLHSTDLFVVTAYLTPELAQLAGRRRDLTLLVTGFPDEEHPVPPAGRIFFLGPYFREKEASQ